MKVYDANDYVSNIRSMRAAASPDAVREGETWYPANARIMREHANASGLSVLQCAAIYSATSANTQWAQNVKLATRAIADGSLNGGTLGSTCAKVNAIIAGAPIFETLSSDPKALKTKNFTLNMSGTDYDAVTCDRWHVRAATAWSDCEFRGTAPCARNKATGALIGRGHGCGYVPKGAEYEAIAAATRTVAAEFGETPATTQAIVWCVIRGTGE